VPGVFHQGVLWLFEDDPWLAFDVLGLRRPVDGTPLDRRAEAERDAPQMFKIHPYFPDLVLVHRDPDVPGVGIVITIEAQDDPDRHQRYRIPVCQAILADKHQLQTWPVVVSFSESNTTMMRSWAVAPPPRFDALVLAVDNVPRIVSLEQARQRPALTALSAALHGCNGDLESVRVAIAVFRELPDARQRRYTLTVLAALSEQDFEIMKGELRMQEKPDPLRRIEERSGLLKYLRRAYLEEGLEKGLEKGRKQGRKEGLEQGRKALVEMIFAALEVREIAVDDDTAARIRNCADLRKLQRWARRALQVESAAQLFKS
jgi:hypothetical protein